MIPKKRALVSVLFCLFLASCQAGYSTMKDGYYTAEAAGFDAHGWKEYLTICVSSGRITMVEYNAFNPSGFIKSWDMDYMRVMNAHDGTYPNAYVRAYKEQLLNSQGTAGIECLSGATTSYHSFLQLAEAALENSRSGIQATRLVQLKDVGRNNDDPAFIH